MKELMKDCTCALVACVWSYTHPATIGAVGCRRTGVISNVRSESLHSCEVRPIVDSIFHGTRDTLDGVCVAVLTDGVADRCLRQGIEMDSLAIISLSAGHDESTHIIACRRREVLQPVDAGLDIPIGRELLRHLRVIDCWVGCRGIADALLGDGIAIGLHLNAGKGLGGTACIARLCRYLRLLRKTGKERGGEQWYK